MKPTSTSPHEQRLLLTAILLLAFAAVIFSGLRLIQKDPELLPQGDHAWDIAISITVDAKDGETRLAIATPPNTPALQTIGQQVSHPSWRQQRFNQTKPDTSRRITLLAADSGRLNAEVIFTIRQSASPNLPNKPARTLSSSDNALYLRDHPLFDLSEPIVKEAVDAIAREQTSRSDQVDALFDFSANLSGIRAGHERPVAEILARKQASSKERAYTLVALSRASGIPARLAKGFILKETDQLTTHFWVEIFLGSEWIPFDPTYQHRRHIPANYLAFARGTREMVEVSGSSEFFIQYAINSTDLLMEAPDPEGIDWKVIFDLSRLPLDTRIALAGLMLLPFGVWLTAAFEQLIGVRFYGVFTPALLAMSLSFVPWQSALLILAVVLAIGVLGQAAIPLKLSRITRLTIVFTLVTLSLALAAAIMASFQISFGNQMILLPVVILASMVDRFYKVMDEKGLRLAMIRLGWTLLIALSCMPIFQMEWLGHFLIRHPELHLFTLAATLALMLYQGPRLAQRQGFKWLAPEEKTPPIQSS